MTCDPNKLVLLNEHTASFSFEEQTIFVPRLAYFDDLATWLEQPGIVFDPLTHGIPGGTGRPGLLTGASLGSSLILRRLSLDERTIITRVLLDDGGSDHATSTHEVDTLAEVQMIVRRERELARNVLRRRKASALGLLGREHPGFAAHIARTTFCGTAACGYVSTPSAKWLVIRD